MVLHVQCILTGVMSEECGSQLMLVIEEFIGRCFAVQVQNLKRDSPKTWRERVVHVLRHPTTWDSRDVEEELVCVNNNYRDVARIYTKTFERYIDMMRTASERAVVHVTVPPFPVFLQKILQVISRSPAFVSGDFFEPESILSSRMMLADAVRLGLERCRLEYTNTIDAETDADADARVDEWDSVSQAGGAYDHDARNRQTSTYGTPYTPPSSKRTGRVANRGLETLGVQADASPRRRHNEDTATPRQSVSRSASATGSLPPRRPLRADVIGAAAPRGGVGSGASVSVTREGEGGEGGEGGYGYSR